MYTKEYLEKLPVELLEKIIIEIDLNDLKNFCNVSLKIKNICENNTQVLFNKHFKKISKYTKNIEITFTSIIVFSILFSNSSIKLTESVIPILQHFPYSVADKSSLLILINIMKHAKNEHELIMEQIPDLILDCTGQDAIMFVVIMLLNYFLSRWLFYHSGESNIDKVFFENDGEYISILLQNMVESKYSETNFLLMAKIINKFNLDYYVSGDFVIMFQEDILEFALENKYYKFFKVMYNNDNKNIINKNYFLNLLETTNNKIVIELLKPFVTENIDVISRKF